MKWNKFRLKTTTEAEDIVSSMLMDLGIQGVEIEDKIPLTQSDKEQMFVDILPQTEADDGVAYLSFYLEPEEDKEKILSDVRKELEEMSAYVNVGLCKRRRVSDRRVGNGRCGLGEQLEAVFSPVLCRRCFDHSVMGRGKAGRRR